LGPRVAQPGRVANAGDHGVKTCRLCWGCQCTFSLQPQATCARFSAWLQSLPRVLSRRANLQFLSRPGRPIPCTVISGPTTFAALIRAPLFGGPAASPETQLEL